MEIVAHFLVFFSFGSPLNFTPRHMLISRDCGAESTAVKVRHTDSGVSVVGVDYSYVLMDPVK